MESRSYRRVCQPTAAATPLYSSCTGSGKGRWAAHRNGRWIRFLVTCKRSTVRNARQLLVPLQRARHHKGMARASACDEDSGRGHQQAAKGARAGVGWGWHPLVAAEARQPAVRQRLARDIR
eukprot:scaffold2725_cov119-Isochrysis_galbana.AAC.4